MMCQILRVLIYSMNVSADGFVSDRDGGLDWSDPSDELFEFHVEEVSRLGAYILGRRLYEIMHVWETDPSLSETPIGAAFAAAWTALPKIVFSTSLPRIDGNARLATGSVADEVARALGTHDRVAIGGPNLAAQAIELDLVDDFRMQRAPAIVGGGTRFFPATDRPLQLDLVETRTFDSGVINERYRRAR